MKPTRSIFAAIGVAGGLTLSLPLIAQQIRRTEITRTSAGDGAGMFNAYCASCHGMSGKGDGPAAPALKVAATNLTLLTRNNNGVFPSQAVLYTLRPNGGVHGSADMPVWGDVFRQSGQADYEVNIRTYNLMRYIESIQEPAPPPVRKEKEPERKYAKISDARPQFGGEMYRTYCSSCHGVDGTGNGPVAYTLKGTPTDLTHMRGPDGKFPSARIQQVLTQPGTPAHGSSDMPVWGDLFRSNFDDPSISHLRVHNLIRYLESIQR